MARLIELANLAADDFGAFIAALGASHDHRARLYVMDADESRREDISGSMVTGSVNLDTSNDPDRTASFTLVDPGSRFNALDPESPVLGGLWAGSLLQAWYDVLVDALDAWVACPVFTGPIDSFNSGSGNLVVACKGKEAFLLPPNDYAGAMADAELGRNSRTRHSALRALLQALGEPQTLDWQGSTARMPKDFDATKTLQKGDDSYLRLARVIASPRNQFFYDGAGRPRVRLASSDATYDLTELMLIPAAPTFSMADVRNRARGSVAHHPPIGVVETLKPADPLSPENLGRGGVPRYLDADKLDHAFRTGAEAREGLRQTLVGASAQSAQLDMLTAPFLNPGDRIRVMDAQEREIVIRVKQWSLGLRTEDSMSMGYNRKMLDPKHAVARFIKHKPKHGRN